MARTDEIERWFVRRGVPHFIEHYEARTDIWTRALPVLLVAYLAGGFQALDLARWSAARNTLAAVVVLAILAVAWALTNLYRRRRWSARPDVLGLPELTAFIVGPALPSVIFTQWGDAVQAAAEGVAVLAVIYVGTSYGVVPLIAWAARSSLDQVGSMGRMVVRALPLLLLFTAFLFISTEVWQVAGTLTGLPYVATLTIFFLLGAVFVLSRIPAVMHGLSAFEDWSEVHELLAGTPAAGLPLPAAGRPPEVPLTARQKLNIGLVSVFSQALQITFVAVLLTAFFVVFGFLAIPEATTAGWTELGDVRVLASWHVSGRDLVITEPLLRVAGFLGTFTGMYFTVVLTTDATYRDEFAQDVGPQIRQALAVRLAARNRTPTASARD